MIYNEKNFSKELKKMFIDFDATQTDVAKKIGRSKQSLRRTFEDGSFSIKLLNQIADALDCHLVINFVKKK